MKPNIYINPKESETAPEVPETEFSPDFCDG